MPPIRAARCLAALALLAALPAGRAQDAPDPSRPRHLAGRVFNIPFSPVNDPDIRQIKLYVSGNGGTTWDLHATATPTQGGFDVRLDRDGAYAFAIQTLRASGDAAPPVAQLRPSQYVVVDTERPGISLQGISNLPRVTGEAKIIGVQWDVRDENLDPRSLRLEARLAGQGLWRPITQSGKAIGPTGEDRRTVGLRDRVEYRLSARDYAGNEASQTVTVGADGGLGVGRPGDDGAGPAPTPGARKTRPKVILLNKKDVVLEFLVREKGPSGIDTYDLWMTTTRKDWKKVQPQIKFTPVGNEQDRATITYRVEKDDTYGFTVIAHSPANLSQPDPRDGDEPQIWLEVDTTPPEAKILDVKFAAANDPRSLAITWTARDDHLDAAPIMLEYRVKDTDKWEELAYALPNTGRYTVATPQLRNNEFKFSLRMRVVDRAGNQTEVLYEKPVIVDVVRPQIEIIDAMPAKQ